MVVLRERRTAYAYSGHKDPRGYLGVDSNDGARSALRQISLPIAAKVDITLRTLSYSRSTEFSCTPSGFFQSLLLLFYPHAFLFPSLSLILYISLRFTNTEADNGKERRRTSNTVFTAIIIFASYLGSASSYLSFHHGTRATPSNSPSPFAFFFFSIFTWMISFHVVSSVFL